MRVGLLTTAIFGDLSGYFFGNFRDQITPIKGKGKGQYSFLWEPHLRATGYDLPYGITQCYLPPDTSERAPPNPSHAGRTRFTYPGGMEG